MIFSILDKIVFAIFALTSHFILAKFLDIGIYGGYIYIQSILYITIQFCGLGIKNIYIKEYSGNKRLLKVSTFTLKANSFLVFILIYIIGYYVTDDANLLYVSFLLIPSIVYILDQYEWDNEIRSNFKKIFYIRLIVLVMFMAVRVGMIYINVNFIWLLFLYVIELPICYLIQFLMTKESNSISINKLEPKEVFKCSKDLLLESWPILAALLVAMIYNRVDQIMLKNMIGDVEVALYGISVKLTEPFNIFVTGIVSYLYPQFVKNKKNQKCNINIDISKWFYFVLASGIFISLVIHLVGESLLSLFGNEYLNAKSMLEILALNIPLMFVGVYVNSILVLHNLQRLIFVRSLIGCITNVLLNLILIPHYGGVGAAVATLITMFFINVIYYLVSPQTRYIVLNCIFGVFNK